MKNIIVLSALLLSFAELSIAFECNQFTGSTMSVDNLPNRMQLNTNYPASSPSTDAPWKTIDFQNDWQGYMEAVFSTIENDVQIDDNRVRIGSDSLWYQALWMDYGNAGREPLNGLTRERGPDDGDVAPNSPEGGQVWAVGWYNQVGATTFAEVYNDPCNPKLSDHLDFSENAVSIKFLFTTIDKNVIPYLDGAPEIEAMIDSKANEGSFRNAIPANRVKRKLRLLQVDLAVKDERATDTGWVFATYAWMQNNKLNWKENLVPVTLMWGDDPMVYDDDVKQSFINTTLKDKLYGWDDRPFLGFMGRGNGPADNARSSCISCHGSAQYPRPSIGNLNARIDLDKAQTDFQYRKKHVDERFNNLKSGELFDSTVTGASPLGYSLQMQNGIERLCAAWCDKAITNEPDLCSLDPYRYVPRRCTALRERQNIFQRGILNVEEFFRSDEENLNDLEVDHQLSNPRG